MNTGALVLLELYNFPHYKLHLVWAFMWLNEIFAVGDYISPEFKF
jgi:hypothetical protein